MSFKEQLIDDVSAVFLNAAEFADTLEVDGASVSCILDDSRSTDTTIEGVALWDATLHVPTAATDFPVINQRMVVDGRDATVVGTEENGGILSIRLRWYES